MRCLILSDIHANWEALQAVLAQAEGSYDRILCCGDIVGYGADPNLVTDWVRTTVPVVVRGNHDKACSGSEDLEWFNPAARASALWTQAEITPENLAYLRALQQGPAWEEKFQLVHGSPLDEDEYLVSEHDAAQIFPYLEAQLTFFGHTHIQGGFWCHRNGTRRIQHTEVDLEPDAFYLLNPGSVGQPRDGDPRAAYAIYETTERRATYGRVDYDIETAQKKILDAGLPEVLAIRLSSGS